MYCFAARHKSRFLYRFSLTWSLQLVLEQWLKTKYLILATSPTAKYYYIWYMYRCMGVHRCMGAIQTYGGCMGTYKHTGRHTDVLGHTDKQGGIRMYGAIQTYWGCMGYTDVWGMYRCMGCIDVGSYRYPQTYRQPDIHPTCLPTTPLYYIPYKI